MNRKYISIVAFTLFLLTIIGIMWHKYHVKTQSKSTTKNSSHTSLANIKNIFNKKPLVPVAVIGSGPAGLSAALYTARAALYTVVFQGPQPGGQLTTTSFVENWPGTQKLTGTQLIDQNRKQAEEFGALISNDTITKVDFTSWPYKLKTDEGHELYALTVIIATGAIPKKLNVPGEQEYFSHGVSTCAICDAPFYKNKDIIVVGGGDSAVEEATLLASHAKNVTILARGSHLRAAPVMRQRIQQSPKIKILYNTQITKILGKGTSASDKAVTSVELKNTQDNTLSSMPIDGVFLAIGHVPNTHIFKDYLKTDDNGYISLATRSQETSLLGVFAAGDVSDSRYRQAGVAAGDGSKAGLDAIAFLQEIGFTEEIAHDIEESYYDPEEGNSNIEIEHIITNKDFDKLAQTAMPVVVKVGADYCPGCKIMQPIIKSVAAHFTDKAHFAHMELEDNPKELVSRFNLDGKSIPALLIFKNGKLIDQYYGKLFSKRELRALLNTLLK